MNALPAPSRQRVVVVDDTADLRDLLHLALDRAGFEVVAEAGDGRAGIEAVREHRPDVVLLDLAMPVMDGIEALPPIRRLVPEAAIVVLSGFGAQQMSARAVAAGADGYVQKGAPLKTILEYVRSVVDGERPGQSAVAPIGSHAEPRSTPHADHAPGTTSGPSPAAPAPAPEAGEPRPLSVVPPASTSAVAAAAPPADIVVPGERHSPPAPVGTVAPLDAEQTRRISAWEALRLAPYGVVEVADEPLFRIVHVNPVAARLLGIETANQPLALVAPELASLVSYYRLDNDATFEVELEGKRMRASVRRTGWSLLVFLDSASEDVGMLRRAIATTAHEVRGPVAVLCGIAETLTWDGDLVSPEQTTKLMASVARQARILDRITADLLTAAQIQRGTLRVDLQVVDPVAIVRQVLEDRFTAEVVVEDVRCVRADPVRLEQMITNLLSNAQKYGEPPFCVRIRPGRGGLDGDAPVCIDVEDRGDGVPDGFAQHLFREFARAHDAVATGTGLGLFVVRTLAQAQGGDISHRDAVPHGSVFTITLPAVAP